MGYAIPILADCTGSPTSYQWTGCSSDTISCIATSAVPGIKDYEVRLVSAMGTLTLRLQLDWQP